MRSAQRPAFGINNLVDFDSYLENADYVISGEGRIDSQSASGTALLTGAVQNLVPLLPAKWRSRTRLMIRPDFLHDRSTLNARCILHLRPGTILITAGLMLWASAMQQLQNAREALPQWNILSPND